MGTPGGVLEEAYLANGRISHVRRAVYRIVHFPAGEHEDLATLWLVVQVSREKPDA